MPNYVGIILPHKDSRLPIFELCFEIMWVAFTCVFSLHEGTEMKRVEG